MSNLYISTYPAPYRIDLCSMLCEELQCEIYHYKADTDNCFSESDLLLDAPFENHYLPVGSIGGKYYARDLPSLLERLRPKLVLVQEYSLIALQLLRYRRHYGYRLVSICDDSLDMIAGNDFSRAHRLARHWVPRLVDEIILPSDAVAAWYRSRFGKGIAMPIIADDKRLRREAEARLPQAASLRERYGLSSLPLVLFVGRMVRLKNLETLLQAFAPLQDRAQLALVGNGLARAEWEERARALGVPVHWIGSCQGGDLLDWYQNADVLVLPSQQEAYGAVTGEALSMGCPVLVSCKAGSAALVEPGKNGYLFHPDSADDLRESLQRVLGGCQSRPLDRLRENLLPVHFAPSAQRLLSSLQLL